MSHKLFLRQQRARWCLKQEDLSQLLGVHQGRISAYEQGALPPLSVALGLQVIFDKQPRSFFASLYAAIEEQVMTRAAQLERSVRDRSDYESVQKCHLLDAMMARATSRTDA